MSAGLKRPSTVYLDPDAEREVEDLAQRVDLPRAALLRRLVVKGLETVGGDPLRLLLRAPEEETCGPSGR